MIYLRLFIMFFKIGLFTIGGGYAMIPIIRAEAVSNGWLTDEQLLDFIGISESTPGPIAINLATFVGIETGGIFGAITATLGVVLPSFIVILLIARYFHGMKENIYVQGALSGLRPAAVGLVAAAALSLSLTILLPAVSLRTVLSTFPVQIEWKAVLITASALFVNRMKKGIHPIIIVLISALLGILLYGILPG